MSTLADRPTDPVVGRPEPHESAALHVTGTALYTDDLVGRTKDVLHAYPVQAPHARARVEELDITAAEQVSGVVKVLTAVDVPGINDGNEHEDEPVFPGEVQHYGQAVCWVLGESLEAARLGAEAVQVRYTELPSLVSLTDAIEAGSYQGPTRHMERGDVDAAFATAPHVFSGELDFAGQEHFYLETQAALAYQDEAGQMFVQSSTQNPTGAQHVIADLLDLDAGMVTVQSLRMGGGFGGKETQSNHYAGVAALGAAVTGRPVRVRLNRTQDLTMTGKRHGFRIQWTIAFDDGGQIQAYRADLVANGGWNLDLSVPVVDRAVIHSDNAYYLPNAEITGRIARNNVTSQTAFRGFGGPQGMLGIEDAIGRCAPLLGIPAHELRRRNLYQRGQTTPYGQEVEQAPRLHAAWQQVLTSGEFERRSREVEAFNAAHPHTKRGLAITPVKFGIAFGQGVMNQAGALVLVYRDGSVLVNHGGTEMGQGLHTKMLQVAATTLGVRRDRVRLAPTRTDKVPNTSATAASTGADLNGAAVKDACEQIRDRLAVVAAQQLGVHPQDLVFAGSEVYARGGRGTHLAWEDLISKAYEQQVQLHAAGFYRIAGLHWDAETMQGHPYKYFVHAAALAEVEVDGFTGAYSTRRVDIVYDAGDSLSPIVDLGQIEGGFVQGAGWLTLEDLRWDTSESESRGRLSTQAASTYKLPSFSEMPAELNVSVLTDATEHGAVYGSKAVGEPPLPLAISVREALRQAAAAFGPEGLSLELASPATPEQVYWAVQRARAALDEGDPEHVPAREQDGAVVRLVPGERIVPLTGSVVGVVGNGIDDQHNANDHRGEEAEEAHESTASGVGQQSDHQHGTDGTVIERLPLQAAVPAGGRHPQKRG